MSAATVERVTAAEIQPGDALVAGGLAFTPRAALVVSTEHVGNHVWLRVLDSRFVEAGECEIRESAFDLQPHQHVRRLVWGDSE